MRLKSLEVQGYKSFANKVEFVFDEGITAVVGPNGSGKSNVADAIRWVLGEQSYSNLRGKKTEDMIFSGSDGRARLGMASATLVLDNTEKWLPLDFSEVTISRRAYRSGENEYYLNGSRVRLKDVVELLAKGGLSRQTYTVVGQGTIDRVLSLHTNDRRQLFEEAAGITFHRKQRADALSKLEKTQSNLLRLHDILKEIEPRLRRLEKQAERTQEYTLIKSHLDGLLKIWYGYNWGQAQIALKESTMRLHEGDALLREQKNNLLELNQKINALRTEQTEKRASLSLWYSENNQLNKQFEAIQRILAVNEERARQYAAQREEILDELQPLKANLQAQKQQVEHVETALIEINRQVKEAEVVLQKVRLQLEAHESERQTIVARQATAEKEARKLNNTLGQQQAHLSQLAERRTILQTEQKTRTAELDKLLKQQLGLKEKHTQLSTTLSELEGELLAMEMQQEKRGQTLSQLNQAAESLKGQMATFNRQEDTLKGRQDLLEKLRNDMSGYFAGVRTVLKPQAGLEGIVGTISQLIQAPPDLEVALETALGGRLQDVVVENFSHAESAIAYLKKNRAGRATFLPLDTIRPGKAAQTPTTPGILGLASELVTVTEAWLKPIAELTLNRTIVAQDLTAARRAFEVMQGGFQIVTREGEQMRSGGAVTGGRIGGKRGQEGTFLAREREWRELPHQIAKIVKKHDHLSNQLADNHEQAAATRKEVQTLVDQQRQRNKRQQEVQASADKISRTLEQLNNNVSWQEDLQAKAEAELSKIDKRQISTQSEIEQLTQAQQEAEARARQLAVQVQSLSAESLQAEANQAKNALETSQARQRSQQSLLDSHKNTEQQLRLQIETKQARSLTLASQREELLAQQQTLQSQIGGFETQLAVLGEKIQVSEKELAELEAQQLQQEHDESDLRQRVQWLETEHSGSNLEAARCQDELDNLYRHIREDLGLVNLAMSDEQVGQPVLPIESLVTDLPLVEELQPGVEEDVKRLKVQIRRLGNINLDALREYEETKERHTFLSDQVSDLEAAVRDLREVIIKLDTAMQEAFIEIFQKVVLEFQRYFKALFGGGEAKLLLTEPDNLIETGVDIVVRPPGKRLQNMALLSGGERSLTAQALIFALLKISPTPFVIFDEVDAMLDEANVSRFRDALSNLAKEIQFIIITHNRKTIEAANTLYGISMGDDSVSQSYSLKIDEWLEEKDGAK